MFLSDKNLKKELEREKLSKYLPYLAYDKDRRLYINQDDTVGFILSYIPFYICGSKVYDGIKGLLNYSFKEGTIIQFLLIADDFIEPFLQEYIKRKTRLDPLVLKATEKLVEFYKKGTKGLKNMADIPIRIFYGFISVKIPLKFQDYEKEADKIAELRHIFKEKLKGLGLFTEEVEPSFLLLFLRRLFNDDLNDVYDDNLFIKDQIISANTSVEQHLDYIKIKDKFLKVLTPKAFPREITDLTLNLLTGGIKGIESDFDQIRSNFAICINFIFRDLKNELITKGNYILYQKAFLGFAASLQQKQEEINWMFHVMNEGEKFIKVIPTLLVWSDDQEKFREGVSSARRVWEGQGFYMQEEKGLNLPLFLASLPFGLYEASVKLLDRDFIFPITTAARLVPIQGDYAGNGNSMLFVGRKGQIVGLDLFSDKAQNYNAVVTASSGAGKSFFVNYLVFNTYAENGIIRVIDIGGSYKKLVKMLGAKYIDIAEENVCVNPFSFIRIDDEGLNLNPVIAVVASMCNVEENTIEYRLIQDAVEEAYRKEGNEASIDTVHQILKYFEKHTDIAKEYKLKKKEFLEKAQNLAYILKNFTIQGKYGRFFNGKATLNIEQDDLIVLELEKLKTDNILFKVMTLQIINAITADLYLSDRTRPRLIIFDEAWQFMGESSHLRNVIEEGYRKARKYLGSFVVVLQSDLDLINFGRVGDAITTNSFYKIKLQSFDYDKAREQKIINLDDFTFDLLKSIRSVKGQYSELFIETGNSIGIARLVVDKFSYYIYTSDARDVAKIEELLKEGYSYEDAIEKLLSS